MEKKKTDNPVCMFDNKDCFALDDLHRCRCLVDTDFGGKPCPFYKSAEQTIYADIEKAIEKYSCMRRFDE